MSSDRTCVGLGGDWRRTGVGRRKKGGRSWRFCPITLIHIRHYRLNQCLVFTNGVGNVPTSPSAFRKRAWFPLIVFSYLGENILACIGGHYFTYPGSPFGGLWWLRAESVETLSVRWGSPTVLNVPSPFHPLPITSGKSNQFLWLRGTYPSVKGGYVSRWNKLITICYASMTFVYL